MPRGRPRKNRAETQPSAESPATLDTRPSDGSDSPSRVVSGTCPPLADTNPGYPEPSGDFVDLYNVYLARPLINRVQNVTVNGHFSSSFGSGGVVTRIWFERETGATYIVAHETKDPASNYRRSWMLLPDGSIADLDPAGGRDVRGA